MKPGMVVFDVGANKGELRMNLSRLVGPEGHISAFEPSAMFYKTFLKNADRNKIKNITVINKGLGRNAKRIFLELDPQNSGMSHIADTGKEWIDIISLDEWMIQEPAFTPDLIKVDVEGFEMEMLYGAVQTIKNTVLCFLLKSGRNTLTVTVGVAEIFLIFWQN